MRDSHGTVCGLAQENREEKQNNNKGLNVKINKINHDLQVYRKVSEDCRADEGVKVLPMFVTFGSS